MNEHPSKGSLAHNCAVHVFTGSVETEEQLLLFLANAACLDHGVARSIFKNEYMWEVMTEGRNKKGQIYEGSMAIDDTGGFFDLRTDGLVYLTDKAKTCIRLKARVVDSEKNKLSVSFDLSYSAVIEMGAPIVPVMEELAEPLTEQQIQDLNYVIGHVFPIYKHIYSSYQQYALEPASVELLTSIMKEFEHQCNAITSFKVVSKADLNCAHNYLECEALYNRVLYTCKFTFSCLKELFHHLGYRRGSGPV